MCLNEDLKCFSICLLAVLPLPGVKSEAASKKPMCVKSQTLYLTRSAYQKGTYNLNDTDISSIFLSKTCQVMQAECTEAEIYQNRWFWKKEDFSYEAIEKQKVLWYYFFKNFKKQKNIKKIKYRRCIISETKKMVQRRTLCNFSF